MLLAGCGGSAHDHLADARAGLAEAAYDDAIEAADAGLRSEPDDVTAWGLAMVKLEAQARDGRGEEARAFLEQLAFDFPERIPSTQYSATAFQLKEAGQGPIAIQVLDMGLQRFPGDSVIERMIADASQASDVDSAELDMLRSLGYIE